MNRTAPSLYPRRSAPGLLACAVLTCVVAPPVRGASDSTDGDASLATDGGGCGCNRAVKVDTDHTSTSEATGRTNDTGEVTPTTTSSTSSTSSTNDTSSTSSTNDTSDTGEVTAGTTGTCGDGRMDVDEACDDGNRMNDDGCTNVCKKAECGDGITQSGVEECDDGENNADTASCTSECKTAKCGDGFVWANVEECDDGNQKELDDCSNETCQRPRWVFVTSGVGPNNNGNLGGIEGADVYCQATAANADPVLLGTYKAWLTDKDPDSAPAKRFKSENFKGWYRLPTNPPIGVAKGWEDLTSPKGEMPPNYLQAAISVTEKGINDDAGVWTNTTPNGTQVGVMNTCDDWKSSMNQGATGLGKGGVLDAEWTVSGQAPCNLGARLYCFQVGE